MSDLLDTIREAVDVESEVLSDIGLRDYTVHLRTITLTGADETKGIKGVENIIDVLIEPTPKLTIASLSWVHKTNGYIKEGDILLEVSAYNYTKNQLETSKIVYDDNVFYIYEVNGIPNMSMPLKWKVMARKVA